MKKLILLLVVNTLFLNAQIGIDSLTRSTFKTNYSIPDNPAYNLLGNQPSTIMRNSKIQPISLVTEFLNGTSFSLPKSIGIEIAPYLLTSPSQSFKHYKENFILNHTAISFGTQKDSSNVSYVAIGLKVTIVDRTDPSQDSNFTIKVISRLKQDAKLREKIMDEYMRLNAISDPYELGSPEHIKKLKLFISNKVEEMTDIKKITETFQNENWNKLKIDFALGILNKTNIGRIDSMELNKLGSWMTISAPLISGSNTQNVLGLNYNFTKNNEIHSVYLSDRVYVGTNKLKGFLEGQLNYNSFKNDLGYLANIGAECNVFGSFWAEFAFGVHKNLETGEKGVFNSNFNIKYSLF
jgi:hypothetical protein